jgi:hypothetical protein
MLRLAFSLQVSRFPNRLMSALQIEGFSSAADGSGLEDFGWLKFEHRAFYYSGSVYADIVGMGSWGRANGWMGRPIWPSRTAHGTLGACLPAEVLPTLKIKQAHGLVG